MPIWSLVYQFVIGGAIFFLGIFLSWRTKDYTLKRRNDRRILFFMIGGFVLYLVFQLMWHLIGVGGI